MVGTPIRIEAEEMLLDGYRLEKNLSFASGNAFASLLPRGSKETATATTQFSGATGTYDIVIAYFDEDDGISTFNLQHNGSQIDNWIADGTTGGRLASAQSLVRRTISNVSLATGDSIQITGTENAGEPARIDYIEFVPRDIASNPNPPTNPTPEIPSNPTASLIRVEAENMALDGYRLEKNRSFASGNAFASLLPNGSKETATATTQFSGATGTYDIVIAYFDEDDGISTFNLQHNGSQIDNWIADGTTGGRLASAQSLVRRTISNVSLATGDSIQITGTENAGEPARIDYIEFVPVGVTPPTNSDPIAGSNKIIEIMPLGDSITRGEDAQTARAQQNGYRDDLAAMLNGSGVAFDFVGSQSNGSGFDTDHEGRGGWKINRIFDNVSGWLDSHNPEIILLQIGTNDIGFTDLPISKAIAQLGKLVDRITDKRPTAQLIVSSITPVNPADFSNPYLVPDFQQRVADFNAQIPGLVSNQAAQGRNVTFADIYGALDAGQHLSVDGFHPNDSGYSQMANAYYDAIANLLDMTAPNNHLTGSSLADTLIGSNNNEYLNGLEGNDTLIGGGGADRFIIGHPGEGKDTIADFGSDDRFEISATGFGGGLTENVALSATAAATGVLVSGENPISLGQSASFLYNTLTQTLSFDQDGLGTQYAAIDIAELNGVSGLSVNQFHIV